MRRTLCIVSALVVGAFGWLSAAQAQKRVALVIGNSAYAHTPMLANPDSATPRYMNGRRISASTRSASS